MVTFAIEGWPGGAEAARAADVPIIVPRSHYFANAPIVGPIATRATRATRPGLHARRSWIPALTDVQNARLVGLADLREWQAQRQSVSQFP